MRSVIILWSLLCVSVGASVYAADSTYPTRPVRLIVPFPPAGSTDIVGRILAQRLTERLGVQVVVDNRPGAQTIIGSDITARASPDGHTMILASSGHAINPSLYKPLPFDALKDFTPVVLLTTSANLFLVRAGQPPRNLRELIEQAKAKPGQITYGSGGQGTVQHLAAEMLNVRAGIKLTHVPYKGGTAQAVVDTLSGRITAVIAAVPASMPHIKSGKLHPAFVTSAKRSSLLPEVPTVAEQGFPGYEVTFWIGLLGPAKVPAPVVTKLNSEFNAILQMADVRQQLEFQGAEPVGGTPAAFLSFLQKEVKTWDDLVRTIGLKLE